MKRAPQEMVDQMRDEVRAWLKVNTMWSSAGGAAASAIIEWRLQERGYSLWGSDPVTPDK
jgi:hypothetical protein